MVIVQRQRRQDPEGSEDVQYLRSARLSDGRLLKLKNRDVHGMDLRSALPGPSFTLVVANMPELPGAYRLHGVYTLLDSEYNSGC